MALSEREQKVLAELEQQLTEDPHFASQMQMTPSRPNARTMSTRNIVLGIIIALAGLTLLLVGVTIQQIWLGVLGFVVIAGGVFLTTVKKKNSGGSKGNSSSGQGSQEHANANSARGKSSFMSGLEDRWEERRREQP